MVKAGGSEPPEPGEWRSTSQPPNSPATEDSSTNSPSPAADSPPGMKGEFSKVRKRHSKKKPTSTGIWPCKINGCNKEFAREADLKRHQRTTKTHSMPSFCCPQCDASFTRTDALRRHQKSRHDGVMLDPLDQSTEGDENAQSSNSASPSLKGKEKALAQTAQKQASHERPASYYRAHTAMTTPYVPPQFHYLPPGTQITHPTSATRTGPPWPPYFPQPSAYRPSPYYRPHTISYPSSNSLTAGSSSSPPSNNPSVVSVETPQANVEHTKEITAEEVVAAVEAALLQTASKSQGDDSIHSPVSSDCAGSINALDGVNHCMHERLGLDAHGYGSSFGSMEHIMTEDDEPMLNPAELLTQESLAESPPPC